MKSRIFKQFFAFSVCGITIACCGGAAAADARGHDARAGDTETRRLPAQLGPALGRGMLNLHAALQPLGAVASLGAEALGAAGAAPASILFGGAAQAATRTTEAQAPDTAADGGKREDAPAMTPAAAWFAGERWVTMVDAALGWGGTVQLRYEDDLRRRLLPVGTYEQLPIETSHIMLSQPFGPNGRTVLGQGYDLDGNFGLAGEGLLAKADLIGSDSFTAPYLGMIDGGASIIVDGKLEGGLGYRFGVVSNAGAAGTFGAETDVKRTGYAAEIIHRPDSGGTFGLLVGGVAESGSVLEAQVSGAEASTRFAGAFGALPLGGIDLLSSYTVGWTDGVAGDLESQRRSVLRSEAFSVGARMTQVLSEGDVLVVAVTRPLKVTAGASILDSAAGPSARALSSTATVDAEASYVLDLGTDQSLRLNLMTRLPTDESSMAAADVIGGVRYNVRF